MNKKIAYYSQYNPSQLEMPEYCIREDMCDSIASLEDDIFSFGQEMITLSKQLDGMENKKIASEIQLIVKKYCDCYINGNDDIKNLDEYDGLALYDEDEDEDEDYDDSEEEE